MIDMDGDAIVACVDLVGRTGASGFEIGWLHDDVPIEQAGWYAHAKYQGARITTAGNDAGPAEAADALSRRLLRGGQCMCGKKVTLSGSRDARKWCHWSRHGDRCLWPWPET